MTSSQFSGINVRLNVEILQHVVQSHVSVSNFKRDKKSDDTKL